jgi:hypothetical protein
MERIKTLAAFALVAVALAFVFSSPAVAGCTASVSCNNACSMSYTCQRPYPPCELYCEAYSTSVSCSGNTTCTVGSSSVTCDGSTVSCPGQSQCYWSGPYTIQCGPYSASCSYHCPL